MLTIGNLAKAVGLNPATIRYYEEMGVIPRPRRSESGYSLYSEEDVHRLGFIQRAKLLALSLNEIKEMVAFAVDGRCVVLQNELLALLEGKLAETSITFQLNIYIRTHGQNRISSIDAQQEKN